MRNFIYRQILNHLEQIQSKTSHGVIREVEIFMLKLSTSFTRLKTQVSETFCYMFLILPSSGSGLCPMRPRLLMTGLALALALSNFSQKSIFSNEITMPPARVVNLSEIFRYVRQIKQLEAVSPCTLIANKKPQCNYDISTDY